MIANLNGDKVDMDMVLIDVRGLEGDYAEVGVWQGEMARIIQSHMTYGSKLWLFDSLCGHGNPSKFDDAQAHPRGRYSDTSADRIMQGMPKCVKLISGFIPETFQYVPEDARFKFVRIDVDHYEPTKAAIDFFIPRMVSGGVINFDDWGCGDTPGATKAVEEALGPGRHVYWRKN